jgi:hypothetical protein
MESSKHPSRRELIKGLSAAACAVPLAAGCDSKSDVETRHDSQAGFSANVGEYPERIMLLGIATARLGVIRDLVAQGGMPTFARLLREGAVASNCANFNVSKTHPGWITIGTGASAGTHRVFSWRINDSDSDGFSQSLLGEQRQTEYLWEAAERQGKKVIVMAWPDSWPSRLKNGLQVGGACLGPNGTFFEGAIGTTNAPVHRFALGADEYFSTESGEGISPLIIQSLADSDANPAGITQGLAARLPLRFFHSDRPLGKTPVYWLVIPENGQENLLYEEGQWSQPVTTVNTGKWTGRVDMQVETGDGVVPAALRMKLLSLNAEMRKGALYVTPICALNDGRIHPEGGAPEIAQLKALALPTPVFLSTYSAQKLDFASQRELLDMSNRWYVEAAEALLQRPFDLFAMMSNNIDWVEHALWNKFNNGATRAECEKFLTGCYEDMDRMVGDILAAIPAGTAVCVVSEHGVIDPWDSVRAPSTDKILSNAGLLVFNKSRGIDLDKSKAYVKDHLIHVLPEHPVNEQERGLKDERCREILSVLSAAVISGTKDRVFSVVLKWEDAAPFGYFGKPAGDVVVLRTPPQGNLHGAVYPLDADGWSSLKPMILLWGPGIKPGSEETRPTRLEDVAPTLSLLGGMAPPEQCEGRPLWSLLNI